MSVKELTELTVTDLFKEYKGTNCLIKNLYEKYQNYLS